MIRRPPLPKLLYLSRAVIEDLQIDPKAVVEPMRAAFEEKRTDPRTEMPPKPGLHPRHDMMLHASLAFLPKADIAGMKWLSGYPHNPRLHGLPYFTGLYILNHGDTGLPQAVMDATWLTEMRTAVTSAITIIAGRAGRPAGHVVILGAGAQGSRHAEVLARLLPGIASLRIFDPLHNRAVAVAGSLPSAVRAAACRDAPSALESADVVVSATPTTMPPRREWDGSTLADGAVVVALDFDSSWHVRMFERVSTYAVDDGAQYQYFKRERGFFQHYPDEAYELADVLAGRVTISGRGLKFFENLGLGIEDVVMAKLIYEKAKDAGVGVDLDM
jgi:ornithine cyclodeaminase/alanine dehydrogenase-like protein (mu-crystallin family)